MSHIKFRTTDIMLQDTPPKLMRSQQLHSYPIHKRMTADFQSNKENYNFDLRRGIE